MPTLLAIDIGSSSVIAGVLRGTRVVVESPRVRFKTHFDGPRAEVAASSVLRAVARAIDALDDHARQVDAIVLATMSPAWCAMDAKGKPLTPLVTHMDRRSVEVAHRLEATVGRDRHLNTVGCRPFPGGISSTTLAWYRQHEPDRLKAADLFGHLNTHLHRVMTGARVIDPSNASFTGLYRTLDLAGWSDELCDAVGVSTSQLPEVLDADVIAGRVTRAAARRFGLTEGLPMTTGLVDGSAGVLLAGTKQGQLFNVCGSTDVLAMSTSKPKPVDRLLTRALGIGRKWLSVGTLAAAASAIYWARPNLFADLSPEAFQKKLFKLASRLPESTGGVTFEPYLAGERMSIEQRAGAFGNLSLSSTRDHMLAAIVDALIKASAARLPLLESTGTRPRSDVVVSGGSDRLDTLMHRDWPKRFTYRSVTDATLKGLGTIEPKER